ncbi:MAG: sugar phosphate isomerase/epimerase family protein [Terriglobia bacterium]
MLKLALSDYTFPKLEWEQSLRLASDLGVEAVDLGIFAGRSHLRPEDVLVRPSQSAARVVRALASAGLQVADIFGQPSTAFQEKAVNHPDAGERRKATDFFWRLLEFVVRCNATHMTLLPGAHFEQESYEDSLKRCAEELAWRTESAAKVGVSFSVEMHLGSIAPTPAQVKPILQLTPGLALTLDYGHFAFQGIPDNEVEPLLRSASHFHARGACKGKLQAPSNENTVDFSRILHVMDEIGYRGYVALEYVWTEWMRCNEVDNLTETIWLRDLLKAAETKS